MPVQRWRYTFNYDKCLCSHPSETSLHDQAEKRLEQSLTMPAASSDSLRIYALQKLPGVPNLVVLPYSGPLGRTVQSLGDVILAHVFKILVLRKNVLPKTSPVIGLERGRIGSDPRFHCLNHEVNSIAIDAVEVPPVERGQIIGGCQAVYIAF